MRRFKLGLLLTTAFFLAAPAACAATAADEFNQYEAYFTREISDGFVLYSDKKHMRVSRQRRGDNAVTMYDELSEAAGVQTPQESSGGDVLKSEDQIVDFAYRYDYANKRLHGPERYTSFFNVVVRPLMLKYGTGPGPSSARFAVSFAQMGLPDIEGQAATISVNKTYADFEGRRYALVSFDVPAFAYLSENGERLVHWASGAAITDERGGVTYYLAVRNRAAAGAGTRAGRPMYVEQASYATDDEGRALLDLRRFAEGKALVDAALKGETGRPTHHLSLPADDQPVFILDPAFFKTATALTQIGLSVAEGSPNAPGGTAAAGSGGSGGQINIGGGNINLPTRPGSRTPPPPPPPAAAPPPPSYPASQPARRLPGPGEPGAIANPPEPAPRPAPVRRLPGPGEPGAITNPPAPAPRPVPERRLPGPRPDPGMRPPQASPPPTPSPNADPVGRGPIQGDSRATWGDGRPSGQTPRQPSGRTLPLPGPDDVPKPTPRQPSGRTLPLPETPKPGTATRINNAFRWAANTPVGRLVQVGGKLMMVKDLGKEGVRFLRIDPMKGTTQSEQQLAQEYSEANQGNVARTFAGLLLKSTNPVTILKSFNDVVEAGFLKKEGIQQGIQATKAQMETERRRAAQLRAQIRSGIRGLQDDLARVEQKLGNLQGELNALDDLSRRAAQQSRERMRNEREQRENVAEDFDQPQLPDGPGYPQLTKAQRDAISERARQRRSGQEPIRGEGDALEGIFAEFDELEAERIRQEELELQAYELALAAEERRERDRQAWERMKANHPELEEIFGDFIENNMFDFGGLDGKGLSGTVATDLSPYAEWLLEQDINRLNALARAAGYPNLASALADSRNLIAKARDTGFRQWAWSPGAMSGAIGLWASEAQHELARAQVLLGDLLNDSRFIESTAGLSDLAISGTTLATIFRDFGLEDGDIIDITITQLGATLFTQRLTLKNAGTAIQTNLRQGVAKVEIFAVNEGFASPNTAEITVDNVTAGDSVQQYSLRTGEIAILRVQTGK